jgi:hypothetical protein
MADHDLTRNPAASRGPLLTTHEEALARGATPDREASLPCHPYPGSIAIHNEPESKGRRPSGKSLVTIPWMLPSLLALAILLVSGPQPEEVPWWRNDPWMGRHLAAENRNKFPLEELARYHNQVVAWFPDGSGIRDADEDADALWERIKASGDDPSWYTYEFISLDPMM